MNYRFEITVRATRWVGNIHSSACKEFVITMADTDSAKSLILERAESEYPGWNCFISEVKRDGVIQCL